MSIHPHGAARRRFLRHGAHLAAATALPALALPAKAAAPRVLALAHTHTHEQIDLTYAIDDRYVPAALGQLNRFLRDHYTGEVGVIDPGVFDQLHRVQLALGRASAFEVISGYRCPATNQHLRESRGGGVAKRDGWQCAPHTGGAPLLHAQRHGKQPSHAGIDTVVRAERDHRRPVHWHRRGGSSDPPDLTRPA